MNWTVFLWLGLLIAFLVAEGSSVALLFIWFAAGALGAMIAALLGAPLWLQFGVFLVLSAVLLAALRPLVRRFIKPKITATNVDSLVGSQGYVTQTIDNLSATGQVKLGAMPWTARSADGQIIEAGTLVRVERIEGVKAFVAPVRETVTI